MSFKEFIEDTLIDCVADRMKKNPDRTALDSIELTLMEQIAKNRYNNDTFYKLSDLFEDKVELLEDEVFDDDFDRNPDKFMDAFIDCVIAQVLISEKVLDDLNDRDYNFIDDIYNSECYAILFEGRRTRARGGRPQRGYRDHGSEGRYSERDRGRVGRPAPRGRFNESRRPTRDNIHETKRSISQDNAFLHAARVRNGGRNMEDDRDELRDDTRRPSVDRDRTPRGDYDRDVERRTEARSARRESDGSTRATSSETKTVLTPPPVSKQGYDHSSETPYEEFWEDDCLWQASVKTDWKLTGAGEQGYLKLYNFYKWVSYHVMDQHGNVTQRFKAVTDDNRYINQSLLKDPDNFKANFGRKPPKISDLMGRTDTLDAPAPVEEETQGVHELEDIIDLAQDDLDNAINIIPCNNLVTSVIEARTHLDKQDSNSSFKIFMEMAPLETVTVQEAGLINDLYSVNTLMALSKKLNGLKDKITAPNYSRINHKIGTYLMDILVNTFGVPLKKLDFANDWPIVIEGLLKRYGQEWVDNFARRTNALIPTILSVVDVTDSAGNISPMFEDIVTPQNKDRIIPYVDFYAIISVNCTLDQLSVGRQIELDSPLILESTDHVYSASILYSILDYIDSIRDTVQIGRTILSTKCGAMVQITRHELGGGNLVLSLYSPVK